MVRLSYELTVGCTILYHTTGLSYIFGVEDLMARGSNTCPYIYFCNFLQQPNYCHLSCHSVGKGKRINFQLIYMPCAKLIAAHQQPPTPGSTTFSLCVVRNVYFNKLNKCKLKVMSQLIIAK